MIKAEKLQTLINMSPGALTEAIRKAGYKEDKFEISQFLGITNGGDFCYKVEYLEEGEFQETKVFVRYDAANDRISVDY